MNNKLFTFLDPLLGYIDNGRFFREPFRWLYVIFAVLNLLFPIFILAKVIEMDFFKYAEGKLILAFILLFIILRSEEHTSELSHRLESRMPSSA